MKIKPSLAALVGNLIFYSIIQSNPGYAQITVSVTPSQADVAVNQTQQFVATVSGTTNQSVTWSVSGGAGNLGPGMIDATGLYTAPNKAPPPPFVTIRATSVEDPSAVGTASVIVRDVVDFTHLNDPDGDLSAINYGYDIHFRWTDLPAGTTKIIFSRLPYTQGGWTEVYINELPMNLTPYGEAMYTAKALIPPDTTADYFYKMEAFSSTGQLLKSYPPVFVPKSTWRQ